MIVRRTDFQIWAVLAVLMCTIVQIRAEDPGDTSSQEPVQVNDDETEGTVEEGMSQTPPVPPEDKDEEEGSESDDSSSKVAQMEKVEIETTTTEEVETQATTSEKSVPSPEPEVKKEEAPPSTFPVWNSNKKICLLAKLKAEFTIKFQSKEGEQTVVEALPENAKPRGECGGTNKNRTLRLSWGSFVFVMTFSKVKDDNSEKWAAKILELLYDTSESPFVSAINGGKITARSEDLQVFKTPLGKSYSCPSEEVKLYSSKNEVATVRFEDIRLQPFDVKEGKFSPSHQCVQEKAVIATEEPFVEDETLPLAIGLALAILTLLLVLGFSIYRAYTVRKVDYNSME